MKQRTAVHRRFVCMGKLSYAIRVLQYVADDDELRLSFFYLVIGLFANAIFLLVLHCDYDVAFVLAAKA